jgi:hypothetical protein
MKFTVSRDVELALHNLRQWCIERRDMAGYEMGEGLPYICRLLDIEYGDREHLAILSRIDREYTSFFDAINGPHGWAYLNVLIQRMKERELPRKVRKAKQRAWRKNRKLEGDDEVNSSIQEP